MIKVEPIPALQDNYIWLIIDTNHRSVIVVDPGESETLLAHIEQYDLNLIALFITHHHPDHTGGIRNIVQQKPVPVYYPNQESIALGTHPIHGGTRIDLEGFSSTFEVINVPGHTNGHIAYYKKDNADDPTSMLFCGDTLFSGGCGRLFEGSAAEMQHSLNQLQNLPDHTPVSYTHLTLPTTSRV